MRLVFTAALTEEGDNEETRHVECCEEGGERRNEIERRTRVHRRGEDLIL